jgi:guanylate kinase
VSSGAGLTVVSGPTAVGKGTVVARLAKQHPEIFVSVSVTTRPPRPGEIEGLHYHFVSAEEFDALIAKGALLEWATVHGVHRYGTPRAPVLQAIAEGRPALLEIDLQGARQVRASWPDARFVFLAPPSWDELVRRQVGRGTESAVQRERRGREWRNRPGGQRLGSLALSVAVQSTLACADSVTSV